jgi:hypothetical protein
MDDKQKILFINTKFTGTALSWHKQNAIQEHWETYVSLFRERFQNKEEGRIALTMMRDLEYSGDP